MAHGLKRVIKLFLVFIPILPVVFVVNQDLQAGENHNHFIHDRIAPVPALIAETAAKNAALAPAAGVSAIVNRIAASVSAAPAGAPSDVGQWSQVYNWPLVAVHSALLPDQKVLMWDAWEFGASPSARLWDPATQSFTSVPNVTSGLFCAGQVMLPDGRQLVSGGHNGSSYGINHTNIYDWQTDTWTRTNNMNFDRWYPTTISLGDGRQFVLGGQADPDTYVHIPEIFNPSNNSWTKLNSASIPVGNYPFIFLMPNGKVFNIADDTGHSAVLDINSQTWTNTSVAPLYYVNAVMYRPGKLMMSGGANDVGNSTYVTDLNQASPTWRATTPMASSRFLHNLVSLPDGKVMVVGGSTILSLVSTTGVLQSEMWDPDTETWSQLSPMQNPRMYHATALLLPDARVLVSGGGRLAPSVDYPTAEIYSPPYLFKGARPTITNAPGTTTYGANMTVDTPDAASINSVSFVRLSSVTHAINTDQRYVPLTFTRNGNSLTVQAPTNSNIAPPGYYMLFILNANGVPSVSKIIQIGGQSQPQPTNTPQTPTSTPQPGTPTSTPITPSPTPVTPTATQIVGGGGFPSTTVLDNFNRANGSVGPNWTGAAASYAVNSNRMDVNSNGAAFWSTAFGANQEVYVNLNTIDAASEEIDLLLKSQSNTTPDSGVLEVYYNPSLHITQVWTFTSAQGWVQRSSDIPLTLQAGDQFGAKARADGFVEIYRNGTLVGTSDVRAWPFYAAGGSIGLWMINSNATLLDDFGGGNSTGGVLPTPKPTQTPTATFTPSFTPTFTYTPSSTPTATNTPVVPATATSTFTPSYTPSITPTLTYTPSLTPTPTASSGGVFPKTILLENFNWPNGSLPSTWTGAAGSFAIANGQMDVTNDGAVFWNTRFGANQEVFITLKTIDLASDEIDLLLKSQANNTPDSGLIEVWYSPAAGRAQVWTFAPGQGWVQRGADIVISLQPGDRFGARARADGYVEVFKNETLVDTRDARGWTFATGTGFVGVWVINSRSSLFDDFGGGNVP